MSIESAAICAAWAVSLVLLLPFVPRPRPGLRLERPEPQPIVYDPLGLDCDGPVIDLEPA